MNRLAVPAGSLVLLGLLAPLPILAHSFNVDFGTASAPAPAYGAIGGAGKWNVVGVLPAAQREDLVAVDGEVTGAQIYMIGGTALLDSDDPLTTGDDDALMDDMLIGFNDPVDVCVWVEGLAAGDYGVILYAMTPNDAALDCRTRVDDATEGPAEVGGAWPGQHEEFVTYSTFTVTVTSGFIGLHSGLWDANYQSGLNGIQVVDLSSTSAGFGPLAGGEVVLSASPNPARGVQRVHLASPWAADAADARLEIVDVRGRLVRRGAFRGAAEWDGTDAAGRRAPAGVYFARVISAHQVGRTVKLVRVD
ncbi:hypothetical protein K8I85_16380 [bacterium]|nr:hypothetical protein [bacterium]